MKMTIQEEEQNYLSSSELSHHLIKQRNSRLSNRKIARKSLSLYTLQKAQLLTYKNAFNDALFFYVAPVLAQKWEKIKITKKIETGQRSFQNICLDHLPLKPTTRYGLRWNLCNWQNTHGFFFKMGQNKGCLSMEYFGSCSSSLAIIKKKSHLWNDRRTHRISTELTKGQAYIG